MIDLDSYSFCLTYGGIYAGPPERSAMIERAKRALEEQWGSDRPILVVDPSPGNTLPRCQMMAWLCDADPPPGSSGVDGYHLFVVWWANEGSKDPLADALRHVEENGGWAKLAVGYAL